MNLREALKALHERLNRQRRAALAAGDEAKAAVFARRLRQVSGLMGERISRQNRREQELRQVYGAEEKRPRDWDCQ